MLKKTITYTDYNGAERTEDFYFNLTKAEIMEKDQIPKAYDMANCPNCGAPIASNKCEYCGTVHRRGVSYYESLKRENDGIAISVYNKNAVDAAAFILKRGIYTPNEVRKIMGLSDI